MKYKHLSYIKVLGYCRHVIFQKKNKLVRDNIRTYESALKIPEETNISMGWDVVGKATKEEGDIYIYIYKLNARKFKHPSLNSKKENII